MKKNMLMMNNIIKDINIFDGAVTFCIDEINFSSRQHSEQGEDLLQIEYFEDGFLLDVRLLLSKSDPNDQFIIRIIKDCNWQSPILTISCLSIQDLKQYVYKAIEFIKTKQKIKNLPFKSVEYYFYDILDKRRLYWILNHYLEQKIDIILFCKEYYNAYFLEVDLDSATPLEYEAFSDLSIVVALFSEFEEDHKQYPGTYFTEEELKQKIIATQLKLNINER